MSKDTGKGRKIKYRRGWTRNPRTRVCESEKLYSRPKEKKKLDRDLKDDKNS